VEFLQRPAVYVDFVVAELDLAATFCERAVSTQDTATRERNIRNARHAYEAARYFSQRLRLASTELARIKERVSRFQDLFKQLGLNPYNPPRRNFSDTDER
jgi:hypothetical protein